MFGPEGTGQYQGIQLLNGRDSSANVSTGFVDFRNNLNIPDAHMFVDHQTDGGSTIIFGTTPAGDRTSDRRSERLRITSAGQLNLAGNMQFTGANPELELNNGGPRFRVPAANTLAIHNGGTLGSTNNEVLRIKSDGTMGLATNSPLHLLDVRGESNSATEFKAMSSENGVLARTRCGFSAGEDNSSGCGLECILYGSNINSVWVPFSLFIYANSTATNGSSHSAAWFFYRCRVYANSGFSVTQVDSGGDTGDITISINDDGNVGTSLGLSADEARQFEIRMSRSGGQRSVVSAFVSAYPGIARFRRQP